MWTDEQFEELEQQELQETLALFASLVLFIGRAHDNLEDKLSSFYQKYGTDGVMTYADARKIVSDKDRRKRINVLMLDIQREFVNLQSLMEVVFDELEEKILTTEFDFFDVERPDDFKLNRWGADNTTWDVRLDSDIRVWMYNVQKDVKQALTKGASVDEVLEDLDKRFGTIERVTRRLIISESSAFTTIARKDIFKTLGAKSYRYYTKADERVCDECGPMHGKTFPMAAYEIGVTAPPIHPFADAGRFQLSEIKSRSAKRHIRIGGSIMLDEIWKDVPYYDGAYQVSNYGRVKSFTNGKTHYKAQHDNGRGYMTVQLWKDGKGKKEYVHRLVALAFIPNPDKLPQVNHKDEDKQNNYVNNLEWCDNSYNNKYGTLPERKRQTCIEHGVYERTRERMKSDENPSKKNPKYGGKNSAARKIICDGKEFDCIKDCAEYYDVSYSSMRCWLAGTNKVPKYFQNNLRYVN